MPSVFLLQWGRNFIVAETYRTCTPTSQQPRFNGAATLSLRKLREPHAPHVVTVYGFNGAATLSLRKLATLDSLLGGGVASMGPQLYRCGNNEQGQAPMAPTSLQWGRNFYRCGNQGKAVVHAPLPACFNGAATLSLRKRLTAQLSRYVPAGFNGAATLSLRKRRLSCATSR